MKLKLTYLLLFTSTLFYAQNAELIVDYNPGAADGISENANVLGTLGDNIIIDNETHILFSNGTVDGTQNIYDLSDSEIEVGSAYIDGALYISEYFSSDISRILKISESGEIEIVIEDLGLIQIFLEYNGKLYFNRRASFTEILYSWDTITGNIEEVIELRWFLRPGLKDAVVYNDLIYMIIWPEGQSASYLASYDGQGDVELVKELFTANTDLATRLSVNMTVAGNNLFFWHGDGTNEAPLYVSDGTAMGTQVINTEFEQYSRAIERRTIGSIGNSILFEGIDANNDRHLWSSDGTVDGTFKIEVPDGIEMNPRYFTNFNDKLVFSGYYGSQPFSAPDISTLESDGTMEGTKVILDPAQFPDGAASNGYWLTTHKDSLFLVGRRLSFPFNNDLYKSDGTLEGTVKVSTIGDSPGNDITNIVSAEENLYFFGITDDLGRELYVYKRPGVDEDGDGFTADVDCDDNNADVNPGQTEEPYNGLDDDCDPTTLDDDLDQDGFDLEEDCDDTNPNINPDAEEIADNGIDEDCDGMDLITSVYEFDNSTISIYPNPVADKIIIKVEGQIDINLTLYDLSGRAIKSIRNNHSMDVTTVPNGMYLVEIEDARTGQKVVERIMIRK